MDFWEEIQPYFKDYTKCTYAPVGGEAYHFDVASLTKEWVRLP